MTVTRMTPFYSRKLRLLPSDSGKETDEAAAVITQTSHAECPPQPPEPAVTVVELGDAAAPL